MANADSQLRPTAFGLLLLDDFTLISMSSAVETLRMANDIAAESVYRWRTISVSGAPVSASDGISLNTDLAMDSDDVYTDIDAVIVCGGRRVERHANDNVLRWLRDCARRRMALGSTCTGAWALARAGLLDGYQCSIHWQRIPSMTETFPAVRVSRSIYTIDRDRFTSAGGTTPMDMMLSFVRRRCGAEVSAGIAEQFAYERIRDPRELQRVPLRHFVGRQSQKLVVAVDLMEANLREPISQYELAEYVDLSRRQLQRLFQQYLGCTPSRYYLQLRLVRARELLLRTDHSLVEISAQTGFVSSSHFSKSYKQYFGHAPSAERRSNGGADPDGDAPVSGP